VIDEQGKMVPGRPGDPQIIREWLFVRLMIAVVVMNERWEKLKVKGYSDDQIKEAVMVISKRIDAASLAAAEKKKVSRPRRARRGAIHRAQED